MRTLLAATGLTLGVIGAAYADGGAGPTLFTMWEKQGADQAHSQPPAPPPNDQQTYVYENRSHNQGVWPCPPNQKCGSN